MATLWPHRFLFLALHEFVTSTKLGDVYSSGIRLRVRPGKIRLPDVLFLHKDHYSARQNDVWDAADLVMEIVSHEPKDRRRDYEEKLIDYAEGKVAESWIVDPERHTVEVHRLAGDRYELAGSYAAGQHAASRLLEGFAVDVDALFAVIKDIPE